jgi:hypothetical protein
VRTRRAPFHDLQAYEAFEGKRCTMWSLSVAATTALSVLPTWPGRGSTSWSWSDVRWSAVPQSPKSSRLAFGNSVASYTISLLSPKVIRDLELATHGLQIVERRIANFLPLDDGRYLKVGGEHFKQEVGKFSTQDANRLDRYQADLEVAAGVLRDLALRTPPNVTERNPIAALCELMKAGRLAERIRRLGLDRQRDALVRSYASAATYQSC